MSTAQSASDPTTAPAASRPGRPDGHRALVPAPLLPDPAREQRWRQRFSAVRLSLPDPARDNTDRASFLSNASGRFELYCWDVVTGAHHQATDRPDGTLSGALTPDGEHFLFFDDTDGDEFGRWRVQPFAAGPGTAEEAHPGVPPGYPAGLEVGRGVSVVGFADDDGSRISIVHPGGPPETVYADDNDAAVGALSRDETVWVLSHSEHGDSRYPALRALPVAGGAALAELDDSPGKGLAALTFSPVAGDQRLLVGHERRGRDELLIWDVATAAVTELDIDLPGDLSADFYPDARALLVTSTSAGRTTLHRYDLATGTLTDLPAARGVLDGALARPDGSVWYRWSDAATPAVVRTLTADGDRPLLLAPGPAVPGSTPVTDVWVDGPGGRIHALLARPDSSAPHPSVFLVHGGPVGADEDAFDAQRAAWIDAGFATVQVNYRGSSGYGSAWRDALTERVGHIELADIAAVHDHLVTAGVVDADRSVIAGGSWGGFLTLLALGVQPERWAAGVAAVPVADYPAAYADEMEPLKAYDRALFGGSPEDKPDAYRDSSPLTWVDRVVAPVLILAGENDPRCPIRQIENYLDALEAAGKEFSVYRFDAGHGSMVVQERIRQAACEIGFARRVVGLSD